jgi:nitrogen fixation protein FixH
MIGAMLLVIAVNVRFIALAVTTFPGAASTDDFDTSNRYDAVLQQAEREHALGWATLVSAEGARAVIEARDAGGAALNGASIAGEAVRPIGTLAPVSLVFRETSAGHYVADKELSLPGQWDLNLVVRHGSAVLHATRRVLVR